MNLLRTRLAPTPSGLLHAGNGLSFLVTWAVARAAGGSVVLRIDDLDADRRRDEYLQDIFRTLNWLGIDYDEGPAGVADFLHHYSQHHRLPHYAAALERLRRDGRLYACTCSRREIRERSPDGLYSGACREKGLPFDAPDTAWRMRVPAGTLVSFREWRRDAPRTVALAEVMGDFVVRQKNGLPAYQIASLVDDLLFDINFIVRGEDLLPSTAAQVFLAERLGETPFTQIAFWHHPLLTGDDGEKLSKTTGAAALRAWRETGRSPLPLYRRAAQWLGLPDENVDSPAAMVERSREMLPEWSDRPR